MIVQGSVDEVKSLVKGSQSVTVVQWRVLDNVVSIEKTLESLPPIGVYKGRIIMSIAADYKRFEGISPQKCD